MLFIILIGLLLGAIVFTFTFIASKRTGKYFLAPIITFLMSIAITAYGLFFVGGFEGMAYGFLAAGFLIISIIGTLLLPWITRRKTSQPLKKRDKVSLAGLLILFFLVIGLMVYSNESYWIIDQGVTNGQEEGYRTATILEGRKEVTLILGEEYVGKDIEVKKVSRRGPTEISVKIIEGQNKDKAPYIQIGLDEIKEPLTVQTEDGVVFDSLMAETSH